MVCPDGTLVACRPHSVAAFAHPEFYNSMIWRHFKDPVYVRRPSQIVRRLAQALTPQSGGEAVAKTAWGDRLRVRAGDAIGRAMLNRGIHDLEVVEACWRLVRPGGLFVDVGANIGVVSSAASYAMGPSGRVVAFEPHPKLCSMLRHNASQWRTSRPSADVEVRETALGAVPGRLPLHIPDDWEQNTGRASLADGQMHTGREILVDVQTLDDQFGSEQIDVLKLDVEGFEDQVIAGASQALSSQSIRHIIYEDFEGKRSDVSVRLTESGYTVYLLAGSLAGPRLLHDAREAGSYNLVATRAPDECMAAFEQAGWLCLR